MLAAYLVLDLAVFRGVVDVDEVVGGPDEERVHSVRVDLTEVPDGLRKDAEGGLASLPVLDDGVHEAVDAEEGQLHHAAETHGLAHDGGPDAEDGHENEPENRHQEQETDCVEPLNVKERCAVSRDGVAPRREGVERRERGEGGFFSCLP